MAVQPRLQTFASCVFKAVFVQQREIHRTMSRTSHVTVPWSHSAALKCACTLILYTQQRHSVKIIKSTDLYFLLKFTYWCRWSRVSSLRLWGCLDLLKGILETQLRPFMDAFAKIFKQAGECFLQARFGRLKGMNLVCIAALLI